ncbi:MAG: ATP-binding protein [Candidatus Komeilibacteria bacterium]
MVEKNINLGHFIGHEQIVNYLTLSLAGHRFAHCYLLAGPAHSGKRTLAIRFSQALLCSTYIEGLSDSNIPCGQCDSCRHWQKNIHPDYFELRLQEDKKMIGIDQVRQWQRSLANKSFLSKYKIGLISQAQKLTVEAANALLKIIEEPVGNTIIMVLADDLHLLLPTIISRSQLLKFSLVPSKSIAAGLIDLGADQATASLIAGLACGLPGLAVNYLRHPQILAEYEQQLSDLLSILSASKHEQLAWIEKNIAHLDMTAAQHRLDEFSNHLLLLFRAIYLQQNALPQWHHLPGRQKQLNQLAHFFSEKKIMALLDKLLVSQAQRQFNLQPRLLAEDLLLSI